MPSWNATQDAEYYPVYAYTGGQWQHVEDISGTAATYDYEQRGWDMSELQLKILACKAKPWWVYVAVWEWGDNKRCSDWSNTQTVSDTLNPQFNFTHDDHNIDSELKYYLIWELQEVYDNPTLSIYYDDNQSGYDGTLLIDNVNANDLRHDLNTSTLPAGDYYLYAVMLSHGKRYASYAPHVVTVENNQVETASEVIEVTEPQQQQITQIMHNGNQGGSMQIAPSAVPPTWQQDSIIVIPPSPRLENGLAMKIKEVNTNNNQTTITYAQPTFDEVMDKVSIKIDTPLKPNINSIIATNAATLSSQAQVLSLQQLAQSAAAKGVINFITPDMQYPVGNSNSNNDGWFPDTPADTPAVTAGWDNGNIALQLNNLIVYRNGDSSLKLSGGVVLSEPRVKYEFDYDGFNPSGLHTSLELNYQLKQELNIDAALEIELSASEIANRAKQQNKYVCGNTLGTGSGSIDISGAAWPQTDTCLAKLTIGLGKIALEKGGSDTALTPLALEIYLIMGADLQISAKGSIGMSKDSQNSMKMVLSPRDSDYQLAATSSNNDWQTTIDAHANGQAQVYTGVAPAIYTLGIHPIVMRAYTGVAMDATAEASYPFDTGCASVKGDLIHGLTASLGLNVVVDFSLFGWSPTEGISANYAKALLNPFGTKELFDHHEGNCPPTIAITSPATDTSADSSYTITWTAEDDNNQASISLYYDTDNNGNDGTLITDNLIQGTNTSYLWDTSELPEGDYYVYAKIDDGTNSAVYAYGSGKITLSHASPPSSSLLVKLNDTGIAWGGNYRSGNNSTCTGETITQQDCRHGRDARAAAGTLTKVGGGAAGFDFTKLDINGNALSASATNHRCVRDNHTGLIWEVKTNDGGIHDRDNRYRWGGKTALVTQQARDDGWGRFYNDWDTLVDGSNSESLCGFNDWRVPTLKELMTISHKGVHNPSIDSNYFPNTRSRGYWSSSPYAYSSYSAWIVHFYYGYDGSLRSDYSFVRLVRGGQ